MTWMAADRAFFCAFLATVANGSDVVGAQASETEPATTTTEMARNLAYGHFFRKAAQEHGHRNIAGVRSSAD